MTERKFYIQTEKRSTEQHIAKMETRGINGVSGIAPLFWNMTEKRFGTPPTLDEYVEEYVRRHKVHLFKKGIDAKSDYAKDPRFQRVVVKPEEILSKWDRYKIEIEERAALSWRSNIVEIEMREQLQKHYGERATFIRDRYLDLNGGVDILVKINGIYLYLHVLASTTLESSLEEKGNKTSKFWGQDGFYMEWERDFSNPSHIPITYNHRNFDTLLPTFDLQSIVNIIDNHAEKATTGIYEHKDDCPSLKEVRDIIQHQKEYGKYKPYTIKSHTVKAG